MTAAANPLSLEDERDLQSVNDSAWTDGLVLGRQEQLNSARSGTAASSANGKQIKTFGSVPNPATGSGSGKGSKRTRADNSHRNVPGSRDDRDINGNDDDDDDALGDDDEEDDPWLRESRGLGMLDDDYADAGLGDDDDEEYDRDVLAALGLGSSTGATDPPTRNNKKSKAGQSSSTPTKSPSRSTGKGRGGRTRTPSRREQASRDVSPAVSVKSTPVIGNRTRQRIWSSVFPDGQGSSSLTARTGFVRPNAADAYFLAQARPKKKSKRAGGLIPGDMASYVVDTSDPDRASKTAKASALYRSRYDQWLNELNSGHNLLFFGYGSKRHLLNDLAVRINAQPLALDRKTDTTPASSNETKETSLVVVHGLYPGLTIKDVLLEIEREMDPPPLPDPLPPQISQAYPGGELKTLDKLALRVQLLRRPLTLVLHNIDAPGLRTERSIRILASIACNPDIRIIGSFDNPNTPILFSTTLHSHFRWAYHQTDTHAAYDLETTFVRQAAAYAGKVLEDGSAGTDTTGGASQGEITEEGTRRILASVPPMARRLFKLLANRQLGIQTSEVPSVASSTDSDILQGLAKDRFIAREEARYQAQLQEYKDHGLIIESPADSEGRQGKWLWIPLHRATLTKIVDSMANVED